MGNETDIRELGKMIEMLKNDPVCEEKLRKEIADKNLAGRAKAFEKQYGSRINDFIASLNERGAMSSEEKARMMLEMKKQLPPKSQEQFSSVVSAMKDYLKKM